VDAEYELATYRPALKEQLVELQSHWWGPDRDLRTAYFEWKYERNPYLRAPYFVVALYRGEPVGMGGMWGTRWQVGCPPEEFVAATAGDLLVLPAHRKQALASAITRRACADFAEMGYACAISLSTGLPMQLTLLHLGWHSLGPIQSTRRPSERRAAEDALRARLARLPLIWRLAQRPVSSAAGHDRVFAALDRHAARTRPAAISLEQAPRPTEMAELIERLDYDGRIRHVRDRAYFDWRFANPLSRYRFLFSGGARLDGYLILQAPARRGGGTVAIVDWEAADAGARAELLETALRWGRFDDLTAWPSMLPPEAQGLLARDGFRPVALPRSVTEAYRLGVQRRAIFVKSLTLDSSEDADPTPGGRRLYDRSSWDLRMLYNDSH
jgi:GNAT superfamily N-acetyltransferase